MCGGDKEIMFIGETEKIMKCPECGKEMCPYHHYYVSDDKDKNKSIEICKECLNKRRVRRMFFKVQGKTRVID